MLLKDIKTTKKKRSKIVGRGIGSGHGTYSTRGMKGQGSRSGGRRKPGFEGGQTPFLRKMPKLKGFKNINKINYQIINIGDLNIFNEGTEITKKELFEKNLIKNSKTPVKLLGNGELTKKLKIKVEKASKQSIEKLKKSGSEFTDIIHKK